MSDRKAETGSKSVLEIILEFGHKAVLKDEEVKVGDCVYTHDWEVWVKNPSDGKIENYLEKVVFTLHESFKNPVRTITKAPFKISEQGYGGFIIIIDLYFKAPKGSNLEKTKVKYELTIQPNLPASHEHYRREISNRRLEKMQFPTRDEQFKRRLEAGGARIVTPSGQSSGDKSASKERDRSRNTDSRKGKEDERKRRDEKNDKSKDLTDREKERKQRDREKSLDKEKHKSHSKSSNSNEEKPKPKPKTEFTELFGTPIKKDSRKEEAKTNSKHREGSGSKRSPSKDSKDSKSSSKHKDHDRHKHRSSSSRQPSTSRKHSRSPSRDKERGKDKERKKDEKKDEKREDKRDESKSRKEKDEERKKREREKAEQLKKEQEKAERLKKEEQERKLQAEKKKMEEQRRAEEKREEAEKKRREEEKAEAERVRKEQLRAEAEMMDQMEAEGMLLANSKKEKKRDRKNEKKREEKTRKSEKTGEKPSKFKSKETILSCDSDSDFDMESSKTKIQKKVPPPDSSDEEVPKTKEVKANASIVGAIFKQKISRESSNPPEGEKKQEKSKQRRSLKDSKESSVKKKKVSRERSISFSSSDSWSSPSPTSSSRVKGPGSAEKVAVKVERPISSTSREVQPAKSSRVSSSPGGRKVALKRSYSSSSSSPGGSPGVPVLIPTPMSPMSADESGGALEKKPPQTSRSSRERTEKDRSSKKPKTKEEKIEIKQEKTVSPVPLSRHPDEATTSQRNRHSSYPEKERQERRAVSSEDEAGSVEPFCQQQHLPHPSLEELNDKKYIARLQVLQNKINSPHTAINILNAVVDIIIETGNFSLEQEEFNFDICNFDSVTVSRIEKILKQS